RQGGAEQEPRGQGDGLRYSHECDPSGAGVAELIGDGLLDAAPEGVVGWSVRLELERVVACRDFAKIDLVDPQCRVHLELDIAVAANSAAAERTALDLREPARGIHDGGTFHARGEAPRLATSGGQAFYEHGGSVLAGELAERHLR